MPAIEDIDWKTNPLYYVDKMFLEDRNLPVEVRRTRPKWQNRVRDYFCRMLKGDDACYIPSLNVTSLSDLRDGQLVKFRCMIQDMQDPEYYVSHYRIKDLSTGTFRWDTGFLKDCIRCGPKEEIESYGDSESYSDNSHNATRHSMYGISVPGETPWVCNEYRLCQHPGLISTNLVEKDHMDIDDCCGPSKRARTEETFSSQNIDPTETSSSHQNQFNDAKNFPFPMPNGVTAILKFYDENEEPDFLLNEVIDVAGIIVLDPDVPLQDDFSPPSSRTSMDGSADMGGLFNVPSPPLSVAGVGPKVPCIHVLHSSKRRHINPLLPDIIYPMLEQIDEKKELIRKEMLESHNILHEIFSKALFGDTDLARLVICHLVSRIYARHDSLSLGKLSLNIYNVQAPGLPQKLAQLFQRLVCSLHMFEASVVNLNDSPPFVPHKDHEVQRLVSGLLQLPQQTHLLIDETVMQHGTLNVNGLKNLTAFGNLVSWQRLSYDFQFHSLDFDMDVPVLIFSEGRSLIPADIRMPLTSNGDVESVFAEIHAKLDDEPQLLCQLRRYLTRAQHAEFEIQPSMQQMVQEDFVNVRALGAGGGMSADEFHEHLVLARLMSVALGDDELSPEIWQQTKHLASVKRERDARFPTSRRQQSTFAVPTMS